MNPGEAAMFLAIGFVPTLVALELVYRMGKSDWEAWRYFVPSAS